MAHPQIAVFARLATENSKPTRVLAGQKTFLARTMHDIRHDPVNDEIFVTNPFSQAILVFRGDADGEEAPIRVIHGPNAKLRNNADRLDIDVVHNEIYVPNGDSVIVFPRDGNGNIAPIREIKGPKTQLRGAQAIAVDSVNNVIVTTSGNRLLIFNRTDKGDVAPRGIISGSRTGIESIGQIDAYPPKGWVAVTIAGPYAEMGIGPWGQGLVPTTAPPVAMLAGWSINDNGNVPPRWKLTAKNGLGRPRGVFFIPQHKEIAVADMRMNAVLTFHWPEIF
ncbi:MAG: hypothetical protein HY647_01155 [Acidobacteria bacterium]|nr:hypothetical protein [Acidobacteriota bacterium]